MHTLVKEVDYYYNEEGYVVLTKKFHLKKGKCCGNGCTHCPFNFINVPEPKRTQLLQSQPINDLINAR